MNSQIQKPPTPWPLIVFFFVILISSIFVGIFYYNYQKESLLSEKQQELSAISDLKIRQITQWRLERLADGKFLGDNFMMVEKFSEFLEDTIHMPDRDVILQILKSLAENLDYRNTMLIDQHGNVKLSSPNQDTLIGDHLQPLLPKLIRNPKVELTDLHFTQVARVVHLDLVVPLIDRKLNDTLVLGFLVLQIDPQKVLYPLIQSWPTPSKSAETLLIRKDMLYERVKKKQNSR